MAQYISVSCHQHRTRDSQAFSARSARRCPRGYSLSDCTLETEISGSLGPANFTKILSNYLCSRCESAINDWLVNWHSRLAALPTRFEQGSRVKRCCGTLVNGAQANGEGLHR